MKHHERLTGIILMVIGLILIFWPMSTLSGLCILVGWCLIVGGLLEVILGLAGSNKIYSSIIGGIIAIIVGIIFIIHPGFIITLLPKIIGIVMAVGGAVFLIRALVQKEKKAAEVAQIIGGAIAVILGLILVFHADTAVKLLMIILGLVIVYFGVMRFISKKEEKN